MQPIPKSYSDTPASLASPSPASVPPPTADPWAEALPAEAQSVENPSVENPSEPSALLDSPAFPLLLLICMAVVVVQAAVELLVELGVVLVVLVQWGVRRYQAQGHSNQPPFGETSVAHLAPLAMS